MKVSKLQELYANALESLETIKLKCRMGEVPLADRQKIRNENVEVVFLFLRAKVNGAKWVEKQDAVLAMLGDVV